MMEAAFKPEVKDELDTQNFEKFEEVRQPYWVSFGFFFPICMNGRFQCIENLSLNADTTSFFNGNSFFFLSF